MGGDFKLQAKDRDGQHRIKYLYVLLLVNNCDLPRMEASMPTICMNNAVLHPIFLLEACCFHNFKKDLAVYVFPGSSMGLWHHQPGLVTFSESREVSLAKIGWRIRKYYFYFVHRGHASTL